MATDPSRRLILPLGTPASAGKHVVIPLLETIKKVKKMLADDSEGHVTFIRAPVAAGKSTLAEYLCSEFPNEFVMVKSATKEDFWYANIVDACGDDTLQPQQALNKLELAGKAIVIDEAHTMFGFPDIVFLLTKSTKTKVLLFSATGHGMDEKGNLVATPAEIRKKYMWYPPIPDGEKMASLLEDAGVYLDKESVDFVFKFCSGHRGILMSALSWIQKQQENNVEVWDTHRCVAAFKKSLEDSRDQGIDGWVVGLRGSILESRAVHVNGKYSTFTTIPDEFFSVLFGGPKNATELRGKERELTIAGFLIPQRTDIHEEFVRYKWNLPNVMFGVGNALLAEYYSDTLPYHLAVGSELIPNMTLCPSSASDLLARALPFMTFADVVDNQISNANGVPDTPLSSDGLPFENNYNDSIAAALRHLKFRVSRPEKNNKGKVDLWVAVRSEQKTQRTFAIESIMAARDKNAHSEHLQRFSSQANYKNAEIKGLVIIGERSKVMGHFERLKSKIENLEIIGLILSRTHDSYEMWVKRGDTVNGPLVMVCDRVARSLQADDRGRLRVVPAQQFKDSRVQQMPHQDRII